MSVVVRYRVAGLAQAVALGIILNLQPDLVRSLRAQVESGVYQTLTGTTVTEVGDRVTNRSRVVPFSATLTFDLQSPQPSLVAFIPDAVLEGGAPFALTVRSSPGTQPASGTYRFGGDYLRELYPQGTQYLFDWEFSGSTNGQVLWNGEVYWAGGHIWYIGISNLTLVPAPWLDISSAWPAQVQLAWRTNFADYVLESATALPASGWSVVTNVPSSAGDRLFVVLDAGLSSRFYQLRKP